jgi:hypothetical protein
MSTPEFQGLHWNKLSSSGDYQEAILGTQRDGAYFTLLHMPTCYRRGPYRLLVSIFPGDHHHAWGCFDADDQPMRWYHSRETALAEAEAIARVLWADRHRPQLIGLIEDGPVVDWFRTDTGLP